MESQKGFSLIEVTIGIVLTMMLMMVAFAPFVPWMNFRQKFITELRMDEIEKSIRILYGRHIDTVDAYDDLGVGGFPLLLSGSSAQGGRIHFEVPNGGISNYDLTTACDEQDHAISAVDSNLNTLRALVGNTDTDVGKDGYGQPFCILVTRAKLYPVENVNLMYHDIIFVSRGQNGTFDTQFNLDTGELQNRDPLTGETDVFNDDIVRVVSGFTLQQDRYERANARLNNVVSAWRTYFNQQYLSDPDRNYMRDYFYNTTNFSSDCTGVVGCRGARPETGIFQDVNAPMFNRDDVAIQKIWDYNWKILGLSLEDVQNPWISCTTSSCKGAYMYAVSNPVLGNIMTASDGDTIDPAFFNTYLVPSMHHPGANTSQKQLPPYNAFVLMDYPGRNLPINGGRYIVRSVQSKY